MNDVAGRHREVAAAALGYLEGRWRALPAAARLGPRLGGAAVLETGDRALGVAGPGAPLEIEIVLADPEWARLSAEARPSDLGLDDPSGEPRAAVRIRSEGWLAGRLASPPELWLRQRAVVAQDPLGRVPALVREALGRFRSGLAAEIEARYRCFRDGLEGADGTLDPVGRAVLLGRAAEGALALPLLARGEPYPPPRWLSWHVGRVCPDGEQICGLLARALRGPSVDRQAYAGLRRILDEGLDAAGYGESLVRAYRRLA